MEKQNNILLTTTLPYANSEGHIGHALEFVQADVIARWLRDRNPVGHENNNVFFNVGLDQHGAKIAQAADDSGLDPVSFLAGMTSAWKDFCEKLGITYDYFYETARKGHHVKVQQAFNILLHRNLIYKKEYEGTYCRGCEAFKVASELVDGKCPDHPNTVLEKVKEENWFFKLSEFTGVIDENGHIPGFLIPDNKITEFENLVKGAGDISVSRPGERARWGIPVPVKGDEQLIYVWFDALLNYYFAPEAYAVTNDLADTEYNKDLPVTWEGFDKRIQICGPDNLRFQAIIWQAILKSIDSVPTDHILVHGTVLDENGRKMSKSLGNGVKPLEQIEKYGQDAVRYYLTAGLSNWSNSSYSEKGLIEFCNAELADNYGNLVNRVSTLIKRKELSFEKGNFQPDGWSPKDGDLFPWELDEAFQLLDKFELQQAAKLVSDLVKGANKYINDKRPWSAPLEDAEETLLTLQRFLFRVTNFYKYFTPGAAEKAHAQLTGKEVEQVFKRIV